MTTGSEIAVISPKDLAESQALSLTLSDSALMPQALKKRPADVLAIVLTGAELGLAPMQAIRGINIIQGKPSLSADLMGALVKRSTVCEYLTLVESTPFKATFKTKRKNDACETVMSFTMEQAQKARIDGGDNWKKYPDAMLRARCLAAICRAVYPDLCLGLYDSDSGELEAPREINAAPVSGMAAHAAEVAAKLKPVIADAEFVEVPAADPVDVVGAMRARIQLVLTGEALTAIGAEMKAMTSEQRMALKDDYVIARTRIAQKEAK